MSKLVPISEALSTQIEGLYESDESKLSVLSREDFEALIDSDHTAISEAVLPIYANIVENNEKYINETNFTPNIATFATKIQPLLRRIVPGLLAFEICGVQTVDVPTSAVFALKADYSGSVDAPISKTVEGARIVVLKTPLDAKPAIGGAADFGDGATAKYEFVQDEKTFIVKFDDPAKIAVAGTSKLDGKDVGAVYSNSLAFKKVLKNYSGPYATNVGEKLGDDMNQVRINVERLDLTVETRKLKAELTMEIIQDLRALHGVAADAELTNFLETEIKLDLDRSIIDALKDSATIAKDFKVSEAGGRWSLENYEGLYQRIALESNKIAKATRRGRANKMVTSGGVVSALQSLKRFKIVDSNSNVSYPANPSEVYVGTLQNGIDVYQDWFADDEYVLLTYKGASNLDCGMIFAPYHLLTITEVKSYKTLQPAIGMMSRYGLVANGLMDEMGGSSYTSLFNVDFTGTQLSM